MKKMDMTERGRLGGLARARKLSARRRREIARAAAMKRWEKAVNWDKTVTIDPQTRL